MASIDVCMAAYNSGPFVGDAIEGVLKQTLTDFELIVVDDGSTDDTWEKILRLAAVDSRIRAHRNDTNRGVVFTRNRLLSLTAAPLVAIADADDVCRSDRLERQKKFLDANPNIGVVGSAVDFIGSIEGETPSRRFYSHAKQIRFFLMFGPCVWNTTTMYRREILVASGGYREDFTSGASDYELWSRLATVTEFASMDEALVLVNLHEASLTATRTKVDRNIFRVSATMLSDYLGIDVDAKAARQLHFLMVKGGLETKPCSAALELARQLWATAMSRESKDTMQIFRSILSEPLWAQAGYHVYSDRRLAIRLARFASTVDLSAAPANILKMIPRLAAPGRLRRLARRLGA